MLTDDVKVILIPQFVLETDPAPWANAAAAKKSATGNARIHLKLRMNWGGA